MADDITQLVLGDLTAEEPVEPEPAAPVEPEQAPTAPVEEPAAPTEELPTEEPPAEPADAEPAEPAEPLSPEEAESISIADPATPWGKRAQAAVRHFETLAAAPEQGGLGFEPSAEDVKQFYAGWRNHTGVLNDFASATPENAENVATYLNKVSPGGMAVLADSLPRVLAQQNPQAYELLATQILNGVVTDLVETAKRSPDPEWRKYQFSLADGLQKAFTGGKGLDPALLDAPAADPVDERLKRAQELEKQHQQRLRSAQQQNFEAWASGVDNKVVKWIDGEISRIMAPVKSAMTIIDPKTKQASVQPAFAMLCTSYREEAMKQLIANQQARRDLELVWNRTTDLYRRDPSAAEASVLQAHRRLVMPILRRLQPSMLSLAPKKTATAAAAKAISAAAAPPAAPAAKRPAQQKPLERQPGESGAEFMTRMIAADLGQLT